MKHRLILLVVTVLAFSLRWFRVGELPVILNRDEAALGYNAVLLLQTGMDEWGRRWPLALESFGDYKLPGYVWALMPVISVWGASTAAVRLPSVLAGAALIPLTYWFARQLRLSRQVSWWCSGLLLVTPIFFYYSRIAFEANLALVLLVTALGLLYRVDQSRHWATDLLATAVITLAIFTYNTPLLLLPLIIISLPIWRGLSQWRNWLLPIVALSLVCGLGVGQLISLSAQKSSITIFKDELTRTRWIEYRQQLSGWQQTIWGNHWLYYGQIMIRHAGQTVSPAFLVKGEGGHAWHYLPNRGHFTWPQYVIGVATLGWLAWRVVRIVSGIGEAYTSRAKNDHHSRSIVLISYILVVSLAPAVVTVDAPHATRSLLFFWSWIVGSGLFLAELVRQLSQLGAKHISEPIRKISADYKSVYLGKLLPSWQRVRSVIIAWSIYGLLGLFFGEYLQAYLTSFTGQPSWKPGFDVVLADVEARYPHQPIAVVDGEGYHYILTAWYLQYSPAQYFATVVRQLPNSFGFRYGEQVGRYHFIARREDRRVDERVVIEWTPEGNWQVQEM